MVVEVTVRRGDDVSNLKVLIESIRAKAAKLTVFEAPKEVDYSFSFPVVAVVGQSRHFGLEAVEVLKDLAHR